MSPSHDSYKGTPYEPHTGEPRTGMLARRGADRQSAGWGVDGSGDVEGPAEPRSLLNLRRPGNSIGWADLRVAVSLSQHL